MFSISEYVKPQSIDEAYGILQKHRSNTILGGCGFLKLGSKKIHTAIDLSNLELRFISENENAFEIGAMATLRDTETNIALNNEFKGAIPKALENIVGVQFRNIATVGASVFSKYGFSDLITVLLALETDVVLYKSGRMTLEKFLNKEQDKDILVKLIINKDDRLTSFQMMRNSAGDFAILNVAISNKGGQWRIAVGARPNRAKLAIKAAQYLSVNKLSTETIETASLIASEELDFGSNMRGSRRYRQLICKSLVKKGILEVLS